MLGQGIDMGTVMAQPSDEQEDYAEGEMDGHSEMLCQTLMGLGRVEAKLDMLLGIEKKESRVEYSGPELATNPAVHSTQLEFDIPPIF